MTSGVPLGRTTRGPQRRPARRAAQADTAPRRRSLGLPSRPSLFLTVTVYHRRLPLGRVWVPFVSPLLYLTAVLASVIVRFVPRRVFEKHGQEMPIDPRLAGRYARKMAWVLLCSGSYVLCDVNVGTREEKVRVRVRTL